MPNSEDRTRNLIGAAAVILFLLCFAGGALTLLSPMMDFELFGDTTHIVIFAVVIIIFVISPLVTILQVIKHTRKESGKRVEPQPEPPPSGESVPEYRETQRQEAKYHSLESDPIYLITLMFGPVFSLGFGGIGIFIIVQNALPFLSLPFLLFGLAMTASVVWSFLQLVLVGTTTVKISKHPVHAGDDLILVVHHSRALRVNQHTVDFVHQKHDSRGDGTSVKDISTVPLIKPTDVVNAPGQPIARIRTIVPEPVVPAEKHKLIKNKWAIRVKMDLPGRPNRKQYFHLHESIK